RSEKKVNIPPKEYAVLVILLEAAGEIVSKNTLLDQVWGDAEVNEESLTRCIYALRRRVRRRYAKVISRNIDTPPDNNALVKFAWVGQKVCGAGLRLPEFHSGMYLYGPTSQLKLIGSSTFSTSVTVERFS
ncbi:invasion protein regulator, partial [Salmonella enterica subsp. enterica serovar Enteritidis str. SE30663]